MSSGGRFAVTVAALLLPAVVRAQGSELTEQSPGALLAQALVSLAVVVGVIYLIYFGLQRLSARGRPADTEGPIRVVQARHLGGDRWIYLVQVEGRRLIVGGTDGQLTRLAELEPTGGERRDES